MFEGKAAALRVKHAECPYAECRYAECRGAIFSTQWRHIIWPILH